MEVGLLPSKFTVAGDVITLKANTTTDDIKTGLKNVQALTGFTSKDANNVAYITVVATNGSSKKFTVNCGTYTFTEA